MKLTDKQRNCLEDYSRPERNRQPTSDARWSWRQMNWALERGYISVGPEIGAHIITDAGRAALGKEQQ